MPTRRFATALAVLVASVALAGCFGPGIYPVAPKPSLTEMSPGLWRSFGGSGCTWLRVGSGVVTGRNVRTSGPQYVQIDPSDSGVALGVNCSSFWQQPGPYAQPLAHPGGPFADGDFLVNYEVAPGTYQATSPPGQQCTWAVVRGFHGQDNAGHTPDFVRGDTTTAGAPTAVIEPGDFGFTSQGCGEWRSTEPLPPAPTGASANPTAINGAAENFPDPFVLKVDDPGECDGEPSCYFAYSTQSGFVQVPVARSLDLSSWTWAGAVVTLTSGQPSHEAMPDLASWVSWGYNWAPSVLVRPDNPPDQRYVMYYTAMSVSTSPWRGEQCIGIATSASPRGPFVDHSSAPAICNVSAGGTIDASPYVASDGSLYLDYTDSNGIRGQRLTPDGLALAGGEHVLMAANSGYPWEQPRIEGPSMFTMPNGGSALLYSAGLFSEPTYSVGAASCDTPLGPCHHIYSTPVLAKRGTMLAPGGQTPFQLDDGSWELAFHSWATAGGIRSLHFLPITFPGTGKPDVG